MVFFDGIRGRCYSALIEVFLIAMIYMYGFFSCLPPGHLAIYALDFSSHHKPTILRNLYARTAFTLLYVIGIKMEILNSAT
jgi:hypothetical protein